MTEPNPRETTVEEFERLYAERSMTTVEKLHERGRFGAPCDCGAVDCPGFQMTHRDRPADLVVPDSPAEPQRICATCGTIDTFTGVIGGDGQTETRPYGPGGSLICFRCGKDPQRAAATEANMAAVFGATEAISPTGIVAVGDPDGYRPFDPKEAS